MHLPETVAALEQAPVFARASPEPG